jgi:hypothetical protein
MAAMTDLGNSVSDIIVPFPHCAPSQRAAPDRKDPGSAQAT